MMKVIEEIYITVPDKPVRWIRADSHGKVRFNRTSVNNGKTVIRNIILDDYGKYFSRYSDYAGPVCVDAFFHMPFNSKLRNLDKIEGMPHITTPDVDNLYKLILDALGGYLYKDDRQVFDGQHKKTQSNNPHTYICVKYFE